MPSTSHCQISTEAPDTGAQALLAFTTVMVSVRATPERSSLMSLRTNWDSDGYGPMVSVGETAQVAAVPLVVPVVVVVVEDVVVVGLVGVSPLQAPVRHLVSLSLSGLLAGVRDWHLLFEYWPRGPSRRG